MARAAIGLGSCRRGGPLRARCGVAGGGGQPRLPARRRARVARSRGCPHRLEERRGDGGVVHAVAGRRSSQPTQRRSPGPDHFVWLERENAGTARVANRAADRGPGVVAARVGPGLSDLWVWDPNEVIRDSGPRCVGCEERRSGDRRRSATFAAPFFKAVWATARRRRRGLAGALPGAVVHHRRQLHSARSWPPPGTFAGPPAIAGRSPALAAIAGRSAPLNPPRRLTSGPSVIY